MTQYRYLFADLLTNQVIGELPLTNVNFTQQLNSIGTLRGDLLLSGINAYGFNVAAATTPARTALYVDRDGVLVWGGIVWSRPWKSESQHISITAQEFESYFQHRYITTTVVFTAQDQLAVARSLISTAQAATNGNIGVTVGTETSGVNISKTFYGYELKNVYQALLDLSRATNGFDFNIQVAYDSSMNLTKTLVLGYPRTGTAYSASNASAPVLELPAGNIVTYDLDESGAEVANLMYVVGAGSNEGKLIQSAADSSKLTAGWPLLEGTANYSDFTDTSLLASFAAGAVAAKSYPPTTFKVVVPPYVDPVLGSYRVGDDVRLRITDDRFPTGLDSVYRIVGLSVQPGEDGPERATLTLSQGTV